MILARALCLGLAALVGVGIPAPAKADSAGDCLTAAEARDLLRGQSLATVAMAQGEAARRAHAEPLRSRLCRWNNELVYEIILLRRDGKLTHVSVRAKDGQIIGGAGE